MPQLLSPLNPPKTKTEARAIAAFGDAAIPYLTRSQRQYNTKITSSCIHALSLIGGDKALQAIASYTTDRRLLVASALWSAWKYFDKQAYAKQVLSNLVHQGYLQPRHLSSLEGIRDFTHVTALYLVDCPAIEEISPLSHWTNLTDLSLYHTQVSDLSPLANLTNLRSLNLSLCQHINDLSPLANLTNLTWLGLYRCTGVRDLRPLEGLTNLTTLNIGHCRDVSDFSPLMRLPKLQKLYGGGLSNMPEKLRKLMPQP